MSAEYSNEIINAYIDGELDNFEKQKFRDDMKQDAELARQVEDLCCLKKSLQSSYRHIPVVKHRAEQHTASNIWSQSVAALLLLCVGVLVGWLGHDDYDHRQALDVEPSANMAGVHLQPVNFSQPNKIILHIASADEGKLNSTLDRVEAIIAQYKNRNVPFQVEVIANAGGINLLRADLSSYKARIAGITNSYNNISFVACSNALERLRLQGIDPRLIKDAKTGVTAVEQIIKRLQQGWVYIKV